MHNINLLKALRQKFQEWERAEQGNSPELRESPTLYVLQTEVDNPQA